MVVTVRNDRAAPGGTVQLRPARPEDADAMWRLARAAYQHYVPRMGREPAPMTTDYTRIVARDRAWVAECDEILLGLLVLQPTPDHLLLENVAVTPHRQGRGTGSLLLGLAEKQARIAGVPEVRLYTNAAMTENHGYYRHQGYQETHRASEHGYDRVYFSKTVA